MRSVEGALADAALHVAVLVLDDAGHERLGRVEQVADALARVADELAQQLVLGQARRSRACASSGSRPGRRRTASRVASADAPRDGRRGRPPPGRCARRGSPQPVSATAITSSWPAWMLSAWLVSARAPTWKTTGRRLPAMTYRTSFISTRPWPAVKFVTRPPASAKPSAADADECSDSGSRKRSGVPHRSVLPVGDGRLEDRGHRRRRRDRVGAGDLGDARLDVGDGLGAVDDRRDARVGRVRRSSFLGRGAGDDCLHGRGPPEEDHPAMPAAIGLNGPQARAERPESARAGSCRGISRRRAGSRSSWSRCTGRGRGPTCRGRRSPDSL